jgi:hypothetical protein
MPEFPNPDLGQVISRLILDSKSYGILKELISAFEKSGVEYEISPERYMIKVRCSVKGFLPFKFSQIYLEQNKTKRINISEKIDHIHIKIFDKKKPIPYDIKIPKSWKIEYNNGYLYIFFN